MPADPEDEDKPEESISLEVDEDEILPPERYWPFPYPIEECPPIMSRMKFRVLNLGVPLLRCKTLPIK